MKLKVGFRIFYIIGVMVGMQVLPSFGQSHLIDSLKKDALSKNETLKVDALIHLAKAYRRIDLDSSIYFSEQILKYTSPDNNWEKYLFVLDNLSLILWHRKEHIKSIALVDSALNISYRHNSISDIAYFENTNGNNYVELADFPKALPCFERSLAALQELGDKKREAYILNNLTTTYAKLGMYDKALESSLASLKIKEELGNESTLAKSLLNLGGLQTKLENYPEAMVCFNRAHTIFSELEDNEHMAHCYQNMGNVFKRQLNYEKATTYFLRASDEFKLLDDEDGIARVYSNLGSVAIEEGDFMMALTYYNKALGFFKNHNNTESYVLCKTGIGQALIQKGEINKAIPELKEALSLSYDIGSIEYQEKLHELLSEAYEGLGNFDDALREYKAFAITSDSLLNQEKVRSITEQKIRYDTEKQTQEIEILQQEDEIKSLRIREQGNEIQRHRIFLLISAIGLLLLAVISYLLFNRYRLKQQAQKDKTEKRTLEIESRMLRSQMNPHFLFNSLNSIQSYISGADTFTAESYLSKFALLVRNILEYSRINTISLDDDLNALKIYMELEQLRFRGMFEFEVICDDELIDDELFIPPMLMQPFVENAIIHGLRHKQEQGKVKIVLNKKNGLLKCEIKDNGIGREKANQFTKPGKKKSSLGMQVTKERFEILRQQMHPEASMEIIDLTNENGSAAGTLVKLLIPYEEDI